MTPIPSRNLLLSLVVLAGLVVWGCDRSEKAARPESAAVPSGNHEIPDAVKPAETEPSPDPDSSSREVALLAGGCFWGMEEILREIPGVLDTEVGYAGGRTEDPGYGDVKTGRTGHAETVRIVFDPAQLSYSDLLESWFFRMHDPTTKNRQGNDVGTQYRSAIFYTTEAQKTAAEAAIKRVQESSQWSSPVVTQVAPAGKFTSAEDYHQDYLRKNPGGYTCHYLRDPVY